MDEDKPLNRGRPIRAGLLFFAAALVICAGLLFVLTRARWKPVEQTLSDGTVLRVEGFTYGSHHSFSKHPIREKIYRWVPQRFKPLVGTGRFGAQMQTASNSLVIWITRIDPTAKLLTARQEMHYTIDAHGCRFPSSHRSGATIAGNALAGVAFEAFPRSAKNFDYAICDLSGQVLGQVNIINPFGVDPERWVPEQMPITKTNDGLAVQLRRLFRWDSINPQPLFRPEIWMVRPLDSELWQKGPVWICDSSGNRASGALCTNDPAWKIEAHFFRRARAEFRPDEIWTITNMAIPAPGEVTRLQKTNTLQGCVVTVEALRGTDPLDPDAIKFIREGRPLPLPGSPLRLLTRTKHSNGEIRVLVRARDDTGRTLVTRVHNERFWTPYRHPNHWNEAFYIYPLSDSKSLDIEVLIQQPTRFEFFIEPPRTNAVSYLLGY